MSFNQALESGIASFSLRCVEIMMNKQRQSAYQLTLHISCQVKSEVETSHNSQYLT